MTRVETMTGWQERIDNASVALEKIVTSSRVYDRDVYHLSIQALLSDMREEIERLTAERDNLRIQAEAHAQESRTQKAIVCEILQFVSGGTGEPGDWRAAGYVRSEWLKLQTEIERLTAERDSDG